jgi:hypothetical protein
LGALANKTSALAMIHVRHVDISFSVDAVGRVSDPCGVQDLDLLPALASAMSLS